MLNQLQRKIAVAYLIFVHYPSFPFLIILLKTIIVFCNFVD